ncbi:MAG TPA: SDR family oxidoreductase [Ktedonobacteraceae bacterium]|jgi:NAD(P)-dependent dehydrogenase (short-subunit alcohol dehydrogenase family)
MQERLVALVTGGSRGIGAETALALADHGYDVALTYRNKATRAEGVATTITQQGREALALCCDITQAGEVAHLFQQIGQWRTHLDILVLNASGGMERDLVAADPDYPMHINRDAQLALVKAALPLLNPGGVIVFVTSHWAHLYGKMQQLPAYEPVAESKYVGEQALRELQPDLDARDLRLLVVTGDLIEGTITPKLLERTAPGLIERRRTTQGALPTARDMGREIVRAALNPALTSGTTIVVGAPLSSLLMP